jgi:hypothetical protein
MPGLPKLSREVSRAQFKLLQEVGAYSLQAIQHNEEDEFNERLFNVWFIIWPQTPRNVEDIPFVDHRKGLIMKVSTPD